MVKQDYKLDHKVKYKPDDHLYYALENNIDIKSNVIYLMGAETYTYGAGSDATAEPGVEYVMTNQFIKNIHQCMRINTNKSLIIHMKTCGGDYWEGMAIYDAIKSYPWFVTIVNHTHARSMSSLIFQAGNKRVMMPNSYFMFHDGSTGIEGTVKTVRSYIKFEKRVADRTMLDIYAKAMKQHGKLSNKTLEYIRKWLRHRMDKEEDVYLTAKEAVEYGLADEIFDSNWSKLSEYTQEQQER